MRESIDDDDDDDIPYPGLKLGKQKHHNKFVPIQMPN